MAMADDNGPASAPIADAETASEGVTSTVNGRENCTTMSIATSEDEDDLGRSKEQILRPKGLRSVDAFAVKLRAAVSKRRKHIGIALKILFFVGFNIYLGFAAKRQECSAQFVHESQSF